MIKKLIEISHSEQEKKVKDIGLEHEVSHITGVLVGLSDVELSAVINIIVRKTKERKQKLQESKTKVK